MLELWQMILGRYVELVIEQDNQATIVVAETGYSQKIRHVTRTHKINIGSISEGLARDTSSLAADAIIVHVRFTGHAGIEPTWYG